MWVWEVEGLGMRVWGFSLSLRSLGMRVWGSEVSDEG